jgi:hypothetical protein
MQFPSHSRWNTFAYTKAENKNILFFEIKKKWINAVRDRLPLFQKSDPGNPSGIAFTEAQFDF